MAGYSKRSLTQKLGLKAGARAAILNPPDGYLDHLEPIPEGVVIAHQLRGEKDFIHYFSRRAREMERRLPALVKALASDGMLWLSWPKKASGVETDLDGNRVRSLGLAAGLVDTKVCAVDETWSGLKFVYRKRDRPIR